MPPEKVGNERQYLVSDQAGRANILARFAQLKIDIDPKDHRLESLISLVKEREFEGWAFDTAEASFELLARRYLGEVPEYFRIGRFRVMDERRFNAGVLLSRRLQRQFLLVVSHSMRWQLEMGP